MGEVASARSDSNELYWRIIDFLEQALGVDRCALHGGTRLGQDLGVDGDDAEELMQAFAAQFNVDLDGFNFGRHFGSEAPTNPLVLLGLLLRGIFSKLPFPQTKQPTSLMPITINDLVRAAEAGRWIEPEAGDVPQ